MREALGVRTSRSFSVIETGEALQRNDEPSPTRSAVLVRLSHGHIRYGSFQRFAYLGESENIARLADYSLQNLLNDRPSGDAPEPRQLNHPVQGAARPLPPPLYEGVVPGAPTNHNNP